MPSLEFNQVFDMHTAHLFQPHEMHWSLAEHNLPANQDWKFEQEEMRLAKLSEERGNLALASMIDLQTEVKRTHPELLEGVEILDKDSFKQK